MKSIFHRTLMCSSWASKFNFNQASCQHKLLRPSAFWIYGYKILLVLLLVCAIGIAAVCNASILLLLNSVGWREIEWNSISEYSKVYLRTRIYWYFAALPQRCFCNIHKLQLFWTFLILLLIKVFLELLITSFLEAFMKSFLRVFTTCMKFLTNPSSSSNGTITLTPFPSWKVLTISFLWF